MTQNEILVDCHCHFFNIDDVPIYATVRSKIPSRTLIILGTLFNKVSKRKFEEKKRLFKFFELSRQENFSNYINDIAIWGKGFGKQKTILTPLTMDFENIKYSFEKLDLQVISLQEAIRNKLGMYENCYIFPFLGINLSRLDSGNAKTLIENLVQKFGGLKKGVRDLENLSNGDLIGIKLYPTITSSNKPSGPWPKDSLLRQYYLEFFRYCSMEQIPITTHCQEGSFRTLKLKKDTIRELAGPENWEKILQQDGCNNLKINLAHMGGDEQLIQMLEMFSEVNMRHYNLIDNLDKSWSWKIIKLLKIYPNTYADLSAYDWKDTKAVQAFQDLLVLDMTGSLDEFLKVEETPFKLKDKLLWGSDVPMVFDNYDSNKQMFDYFFKALNLTNWHSNSYFDRTRKDLNRIFNPDPNLQTILFDLFVSKNPLAFLFQFRK